MHMTLLIDLCVYDIILLLYYLGGFIIETIIEWYTDQCHTTVNLSPKIQGTYVLDTL